MSCSCRQTSKVAKSPFNSNHALRSDARFLASSISIRPRVSTSSSLVSWTSRGISGGVADVVGRKLRALGSRCQVMCVTHLPQVAAQGHAHWRVRKASDEGVTMSAVERLDDAGRVEELARLLGGANVGDAARAAARSLLGDTD